MLCSASKKRECDVTFAGSWVEVIFFLIILSLIDTISKFYFNIIMKNK